MANVIRDRKDDILKILSLAIDEAARTLDIDVLDLNDTDCASPHVMLAEISFCHEEGSQIILYPEIDLNNPLPNPLPKWDVQVQQIVDFEHLDEPLDAN